MGLLRPNEEANLRASARGGDVSSRALVDLLNGGGGAVRGIFGIGPLGNATLVAGSIATAFPSQYKNLTINGTVLLDSTPLLVAETLLIGPNGKLHHDGGNGGAAVADAGGAAGNAFVDGNGIYASVSFSKNGGTSGNSRAGGPGGLYSGMGGKGGAGGAGGASADDATEPGTLADRLAGETFLGFFEPRVLPPDPFFRDWMFPAPDIYN